MEDQVFNIDYLMQTEGGYYSSVPLYHYWQRADSAVHTVSWDHFWSIVGANISIYKSIFSHLWQKSPQQAAANPGIPRQLCKGKDQR